MSDKVKNLLEHEARAIANIPASAEFEKAIDIIHRQVHGQMGKLVCSGMGKAGQIANNIATTFSSTGTPSDFLHPADAQHGDLGVLQENYLSPIPVEPGKYWSFSHSPESFTRCLSS